MVSRSNQRDTSTRLHESELSAAIRAYAQLAGQERAAALRALSGRLAHRLRNPLAAMQAACNSLREELTDPDHQQRLDLTLEQIDRALALISAEVQAVAQATERPRPIAPEEELAEIIALLQTIDPQAQRLHLVNSNTPRCALRRTGFRVALHSLIKYLLQLSIDGESLQGPIRIELHTRDDRLEVRCVVADHPAVPPAAERDTDDAPDGIGLLIVERFARDAGGRLNRTSAEDGAPVFSLQLACRHE